MVAHRSLGVRMRKQPRAVRPHGDADTRARCDFTTWIHGRQLEVLFLQSLASRGRARAGTEHDSQRHRRRRRALRPWHPAVGPALALNTTVNAIVDVDELCVPDIYRQWGARACERFVVTVPTDGWLHASLKWDPSAPGFDLRLVGEVVLVASTGQFASSDWQKADVDIRAPVVPGIYDLLVLAYSQAVALPFQLRTELQAN
jgi:hypothetical protein